MEEKLSMEEVSFKSKEKNSLPKGAIVKRKDVRITVEEIENGFIVSKSFDISYTIGDKNDYLYYTKKAYFKENPIKIEDNKMLAEYFD